MHRLIANVFRGMGQRVAIDNVARLERALRDLAICCVVAIPTPCQNIDDVGGVRVHLLNLSKAGWSWAVSQRLIPTGERSGLQTHIAGDGKRFVAGREKKSQRTRLRARPPRVGQEKSAPLSVPFAQLNRKTFRWEEVSQALMRHEKKARPEHDLAFLGEIAQLKVRGTRSISPSVLELERQPPCVAHKLQVPQQWLERPRS